MLQGGFVCCLVWVRNRIGCELFLIFDYRQSIHGCMWFSVACVSCSLHFNDKCKFLSTHVMMYLCL